MDEQDSTDQEPNSSTQLLFHPPNLWGLDYHFKMFNKMYVCDVLRMEPYPSFPGAWAYRNHPVYKVDILGVVVRVLQNSKCFMYTVDDGTGTITCCCWKDSFTSSTGTGIVGGCSYDDLPGALRRTSDEILSSGDDGYQLGELIQVRGQIKVFREEREIVATYHSVIRDPMVEVMRMCELPLLYKQGYDKPFQLPLKVQRALQQQQQGQFSKSGMVEELKEAILGHLKKTVLVEIFPSDLMKVNAIKTILSRNKNQADVIASCTDDIGLVLQALQLIEEDGKVTKRCDRRMLYEPLFHESKLEKRILQILITDTAKPKFEERGCHYLHVVEELHRTVQYAKTNTNAVLHCLQKLEIQSDVFRTTRCHYLPCPA